MPRMSRADRDRARSTPLSHPLLAGPRSRVVAGRLRSPLCRILRRHRGLRGYRRYRDAPRPHHRQQRRDVARPVLERAGCGRQSPARGRLDRCAVCRRRWLAWTLYRHLRCADTQYDRTARTVVPPARCRLQPVADRQDLRAEANLAALRPAVLPRPGVRARPAFPPGSPGATPRCRRGP